MTSALWMLPTTSASSVHVSRDWELHKASKPALALFSSEAWPLISKWPKSRPGLGPHLTFRAGTSGKHPRVAHTPSVAERWPRQHQTPHVAKIRPPPSGRLPVFQRGTVSRLNS